MADPVSYADPYYDALDKGVEGKLELPPGLLSSVRLHGEKSNADQVSSAGARTVYQITPDTQKAALDKWGIDPYLNARNASEVAGLLLKDSLDRNKGDVGAAVGEYHGGTDRDAWGPKTQAYIGRVTQGQQAVQSTFDRAQAANQAQQAPQKLGAIYQAYQSGQMTPQERADYEADVNAGKIMLPPGARLSTQGPAGDQTIPDGVVQAYAKGQMSPQESADFEQDVRSGSWKLPEGVTPDDLFGEKPPPQSLGQRIAGIPGAIKEQITGSQRSTPEIEALPDWTQMPSLSLLGDKSVGFLANLKMAVGTIATGPQETAQIVQANVPGMQVRQDSKGNLIFTDPADGKDYAYKPGIRVSDIPRIGTTALAFTPAGRATTIGGAAIKSGLTQAAIEGTQAATGGNFDVGDVGAATALGGLVPAAGRVVGTIARAVRGAPAAIEGPAAAGAREVVPPGTPGAPPEPAPAAPAPQPTPVMPAAPAASAASVENVSQALRSAAKGAKQGVNELAQAAAPNPETVAAADRLGIGDYLQSDHVTTNDAYRQVLGILKSNPASGLAQAEKAGLEKVAQRASGLIDEIGGTNDLSELDAGVKSRMQGAHAATMDMENRLWNELRDTIPAKTPAPATNALKFLEQRADELGGTANLSPMEKGILKRLSPGSADLELLNQLGPSARQQAIAQGAGGKQPTYALLDDVRRDVGAAARMRGPFSDADTGLAKKYYGLLSQDQGAVADGAGAGDLAKAARAATVVRKGMEDDLSSLFGKQLDASLAPQVSSAMRATAQGDTSKLLAILKSTPDDMKQQVVASGLGSVFRNAATRGEINFTGYAKWYEGLQRNKQAFGAVMSHLPVPARQQMQDLYRVSKGISDSMQARIKTGLRSSVMKELTGADTFASNLFDAARRAGKGIILSTMGHPGHSVSALLESALKRGKQPAMKAIDELLTSPEFTNLARNGSQPTAVRTLAYSRPFNKMVRALGQPREMSDRERWITQALVSSNANTNQAGAQ